LTKYAEVLWNFVFNNSECKLERFVFHGLIAHFCTYRKPAFRNETLISEVQEIIVFLFLPQKVGNE